MRAVEAGDRNGRIKTANLDSLLLHLHLRESEEEAIHEAMKAHISGGSMVPTNELKSAVRSALKHSPDPRNPTVVVSHFRPPRFRLPTVCTSPIIMFAAGSGIAPFRSFWQELALGWPKNENLLFVQQRDRKAMPFQSELASIVAGGGLAVEVMLSREDYVMKLSDDRQRMVWEIRDGCRGYLPAVITGRLRARMLDLILNKHARLYICGQSGFARSLLHAIDDILRGELGEDQGTRVCQQMAAEGRLSLEVFNSLAIPPSSKPIPVSDVIASNAHVFSHLTPKASPST